MPNNLKTNPAIALRDIEFAWPGKGNDFSFKLKKFDLQRGQSTLLVGPSGSGKSTLLGLICGTLTPQQGQVHLLGQAMHSVSASKRDLFRADHIGIIFQMFNLLPYLSVRDNVQMPLHFSARRRAHVGEPQAQFAQANELLNALGLDPASIGTRKAHALSVGQQQRVAAARAFIGAPEIIIADEPTSALDVQSQTDFLNLLFAQKARTKASLLMVSHNMGLADRFDQVVQLADICQIQMGEQK